MRHYISRKIWGGISIASFGGVLVSAELPMNSPGMSRHIPVVGTEPVGTFTLR